MLLGVVSSLFNKTANHLFFGPRCYVYFLGGAVVLLGGAVFFIVFLVLLGCPPPIRLVLVDSDFFLLFEPSFPILLAIFENDIVN